MCIAETKLDESFPDNQFVLVGYHLLYRLDITDRKGGLMVFVKPHIPSRRLNDFKVPSNIQIIPFEINLRREKWLVASIYQVPFQENKYFLSYLTNVLEFYSTRYEKVIALGDFNIEAQNKAMKDFLQDHTFYSMMKQNTCFKGDGGSCIDLLITNSKFSFMKTNFFETGFSDHHHMIYTILKTKFEKFEAKKLIYRNFKQFDSEQFKLDICNSMSAVRTHAAFENNFVSILDKHAPKKTKILRGNQEPHFNKNLRKQIMIRSRLNNKANKSKNPIDIVKFKRQRNLVTNLNKQAKLQYSEKLSVDCNSKPFWKACKPYFSNKNSNIQENIMLLEKDKLLSKQKDAASTFNKHFGSITGSLNLFS